MIGIVFEDLEKFSLGSIGRITTPDGADEYTREVSARLSTGERVSITFKARSVDALFMHTRDHA